MLGEYLAHPGRIDVQVLPAQHQYVAELHALLAGGDEELHGVDVETHVARNLRNCAKSCPARVSVVVQASR